MKGAGLHPLHLEGSLPSFTFWVHLAGPTGALYKLPVPPQPHDFHVPQHTSSGLTGGQEGGHQPHSALFPPSGFSVALRLPSAQSAHAPRRGECPGPPCQSSPPGSGPPPCSPVSSLAFLADILLTLHRSCPCLSSRTPCPRLMLLSSYTARVLTVALKPRTWASTVPQAKAR